MAGCTCVLGDLQVSAFTGDVPLPRCKHIGESTASHISLEAARTTQLTSSSCDNATKLSQYIL